MDLNNKVGSVYNLSRVFYFQSWKNNLAGNLKDNVVVFEDSFFEINRGSACAHFVLHQQWQRTNVDSLHHIKYHWD